MDIAKDELEPSRERGVPIFWRVAEDYEIQNGILCQKGNAQRFYAPVTREELPSEISKLREGDEKALFAFAKVYGWLGYTFFKERRDKRRRGDPLRWVWAHARGIRICLQVIQALQHGDEEALAEYLKADTRTVASCQSSVVGFRHDYDELGWWARRGSKAELRRTWRAVLKKIVNKNIEGIHPKLSFENGHSKLFFTFSALIEVAYWHLANVVTGGRVKRCERPGCGAIFIQTDERQRFCPKGLRRESACAVRQRLKRFRGKPKHPNGKKDTRHGGSRHGKKRR